jgi:hypothetical protein
MSAPNTPQPGNTAVPGARAERLRISRDDRTGITWYLLAAGTACLLIVALVASA